MGKHRQNGLHDAVGMVQAAGVYAQEKAPNLHGATLGLGLGLGVTPGERKPRARRRRRRRRRRRWRRRRRGGGVEGWGGERRTAPKSSPMTILPKKRTTMYTTMFGSNSRSILRLKKT